jgi:hypothetical protein
MSAAVTLTRCLPGPSVTDPAASRPSTVTRESGPAGGRSVPVTPNGSSYVPVNVIVVSTVAIFNDFVNPLYFLPGDENATVQLTLYNFLSQFSTLYNLLFMNIVLITIPPLVMFVFFNRKIVSGMTAGAVKG